MKACIIFLFAIYLSIDVQCQSAFVSHSVISKPPVDSAAIANWADLLWSEPVITFDGKYFMYSIDNLPAGSKTLVVQSTENPWKKEFVGAERGFFSGDSKLAVFRSNDSLIILFLKSNKVSVIRDVTSCQYPKEGDGRWLAYQLKTNEVVVQNLFDGKEQRYANVTTYKFDSKGTALLLKCSIQNAAGTSEIVKWINLSSNKIYTVWKTDDNRALSASRFSFDESGNQVVFIVEDKTTGNQPLNTVWYYRQGMEKAIAKVTNKAPGIDSGLVISNAAPFFSHNGKYIFFKLKPIPASVPKPDPNGVQVDVWNYKDLSFQNIQLYNLKNPNIIFSKVAREVTASIAAAKENIIVLEKFGMENWFLPVGSTDYIVLGQRPYTGNKLLNVLMEYYLVSLQDGKRKLFNSGTCAYISFTPDNNYLVYFDYVKQHFYSYNISTTESINISSKIPCPITPMHDKGSNEETLPVGFKGWLGNKVIIYDEYDIWQVDISGKKEPNNLTHGYGRTHNLKFRLLYDYNVDQNIQISPAKQLLLVAFDEKTKQNGFYTIQPGVNNDPLLLSMQPNVICTKNTNQTTTGLLNAQPVKAQKKNVWIVQRQSETEAPNFYFTKDFKTFKQLTYIEPQKNYNWYTTELLNWKLPTGEICQGILYKPENLDSTKKYPVIIDCYEKHSDELHQFIRPDFMAFAEVNKPWFVSRGYIVFSPDIYYTIGQPGESIINSVVTGVKNLFRFPFIDSTKIGIAGHSFGGYETNYLVSHTNIFAAAAEGAGTSDLISQYGSLLPDGAIKGEGLYLSVERGQYRLDTLLWDNPKVYIENSPIFYADKVNTPLLMMHNMNDGLVPWQQGVELFIALRRLNKPVWMLQYDKGAHGVGPLKNKIDFSKRITQFFDHYLKGAPAPKWMTQGIPAELKGLDSGYETDVQQ